MPQEEGDRMRKDATEGEVTGWVGMLQEYSDRRRRDATGG
jgi:hypothetical protein